MVTKKVDKEQGIVIQKVKKEVVEVCIIGKTPLILNRMSQKVWNELLLPKGRKNAAEKKSTLKHDPIQEFKDSAYTSENPKDETYLQIMSSSFKGAMRTAALDLPGTQKSQIGRLTFVENMYTGIFGLPKLFMAITRSADMKRTPDVRTRAIVPQWACKIRVSFTVPILSATAVYNLISAAGITAGVGDWRPEKGSGNHGQFEIVNADDKRFLKLLEQDYKPQKEAIENPVPYDKETKELLSWYDVEVKRRGFEVA